MNPIIEMRFYEILGVNVFRKLVFMLEKLIHRKDKGVNINYHIPSKEIGALDAFIKYLFYNGTIHVRNLIVFFVYILIKIIFQRDFRFYDIVLGMFALKDLYCVILQRYNLLRIQMYKERLVEKQIRRKQKAMSENRENFAASYDFSFAQEDLALIRRIKTCIANRESIVLSDADIAGLERLLQTEESCEPSSR